ncbi:hypothetical protein BC829DRAFT_79055 [Chytridium lagenaria]|nr:hypothetical protein BC829DRAFT_79055 [Chytridium lagenaria]
MIPQFSCSEKLPAITTYLMMDGMFITRLSSSFVARRLTHIKHRLMCATPHCYSANTKETFQLRLSTYPKSKGRQEQWMSYLSDNDSIYQHFLEEGLTIEEVSSEVASIYRSRSVNVPLISTLGPSQLIIHAKNNLTEKQFKVIQCLVKAAGWSISVV